MEKSNSSYLARINRTLIWATLVLLGFFVTCGYGITNPELVGGLTGGVLNRSISIYFHTILAPPVLILLMVHVLIALRFTLIRWGVREGKLLNSFIIGLGVFGTTMILLMQYLKP